jgi:hypothetical protein
MEAYKADDFAAAFAAVGAAAVARRCRRQLYLGELYRSAAAPMRTRCAPIYG